MLSTLRSTVRDALARRLGVPEIHPAMERLARQGLQPTLIFDVGAYVGDFARTCRDVWPDARIACFEPQANARGRLQALADADGNVRVHAALLGAEERASVVLHEGETASSVLVEHADPEHFRAVEHPMTTVDRVAEDEYDGRAPDLLKLDVQGYELEVLKGAEQTLPHVQAILAEVNLLDIHVGVPLLADLVGWLDARGFVAHDICGLTRRPLDDTLWQADMVFVPKDGPLRRDKRWAAWGSARRSLYSVYTLAVRKRRSRRRPAPRRLRAKAIGHGYRAPNHHLLCYGGANSSSVAPEREMAASPHARGC